MFSQTTSNWGARSGHGNWINDERENGPSYQTRRDDSFVRKISVYLEGVDGTCNKDPFGELRASAGKVTYTLTACEHVPDCPVGSAMEGRTLPPRGGIPSFRSKADGESEVMPRV